ncbi:Hypothetical protein RG1141_PA10090 (plasmid) [Neorhizobium galegae bv. officinalis bv. officinalis str. HAMBI 1141]|uniref:Uncharacterized protein n=1 Tax=Neorhizobium galegae bv. officinalis bv. officinalis str. HAMBI 1141 TaxID=1028801 RepID=A0A068TIF8_NEOGA|nr:hypothetical protein [Neorhizobium galegae]CDN57841.1 Hypothetical protein RG1141_PA10090 [Neorhizobium galegae bv. officinalis bv. officinalis str. HAMBI 1141]
MQAREFDRNVMTMHDVDVMREAVSMAVSSPETADVEPDVIARIVFWFYRRGLADPEKLSDIAVFLASSRAFIPSDIGSHRHQLIDGAEDDVPDLLQAILRSRRRNPIA